MKRIISLLLTLIMLLGLFSCSGGTWVPDYDNISVQSMDKTIQCTPLLYKVTDGKGAVLYLLGSIHTGDERTQNMPDYVMDAYGASSYICVEADIVAYENDTNQIIEDLGDMLCEEGKTIVDYIGEELYAPAKKLLQSRGLYNSAYDMYRPALWSSLLDQAISSYTGLETEYGVDRYFINKAKEDGKEIKEVESVEFQNEMTLGFSDELYCLLISNSVYYPKSNAEGLIAMYEMWLTGDEEEIKAEMTTDYEGVPDEQLDLLEGYDETMLDDRNTGMADKAEEYMSKGGTGFYIVGLAHVVGRGALVELLRERGYKVEIVNIQKGTEL